MNRDDPIALLRALDPAEEKDIDALVGRLAAAGTPIRALAQRPPVPGWRRRRAAWLVAATSAAVAVTLAALVANPFSRSGTISSAQAKAQVERALDLQGDWHVRRVTQGAIAIGDGEPAFSRPVTEDTWHAADGRFLVTTTMAGSESTSTLYAHGTRSIYVSQSDTLNVHKFILAADLRNDERTHVPASAADLYRAAYRVGKVRLAGREVVAGRPVYRLAFDWLGSSYTLIFDADRRVPISSESRRPAGGNRFWVTRVQYRAYGPVTSVGEVERHLHLPEAAARAKRSVAKPIVIGQPRQGATATRVVDAILTSYPHSFKRTAGPGQATYAVVAHIPGGGVAALVHVPDRGAKPYVCYALVEQAYRNGEARIDGSGCFRGSGGFSSRSQTGNAMLIGGSTKGREVTLSFANGTKVTVPARHGLFLAAVPIGLLRYQYGITSRNADGTTHYEMSLLPLGGLPPWINP